MTLDMVMANNSTEMRNKFRTFYTLFIFIIGILFPSFISVSSSDIGGVFVSEQRKELRCLEEALAYEAFGEPIVGIKAVLSVIVNRKNKHKQSFCEVIRKPMQFSFRNAHHKSEDLPMDMFHKHQKYWTIKEFAYKAYMGNFQITMPPDTIYFAAKGKVVHWNRGKIPVITIGRHSFYN